MRVIPKDNKGKLPLGKKILLVCLGFVVCLLALEAAMRITASSIIAVQEFRNNISFRQQKNYCILCLGESTTRNQYPRYLEPALNLSGNPKIKFSIIDKGESSINSEVILSKVESYIDKYHPDMIVAMMGSNDRGRTIPADYPFDQRKAKFWERLSVYKAAKLLTFYTAKKLGLESPLRRGSPAAEKPVGSGQALNKSRGAVIESAASYQMPKKHSERVDFLRAVVQKDPRNSNAWQNLGSVYFQLASYGMAKKCFTRALRLSNSAISQDSHLLTELSEERYDIFIGLAKTSLRQGQFEPAEKYCRMAMDTDPGRADAYRFFGEIAVAEGKITEGLLLAEKYADSQSGENAFRVYGILAVFFDQVGQKERARHFYELSRTGRVENMAVKTIRNYRRLKQVADSRGIKLVCVQYPMLSLAPLKNIFSSGERSVIFVDNEAMFKEAVSREGYNAYFTDMFGGEFGHCTPKGNRMLAQNIAATIWKEYLQTKCR